MAQLASSPSLPSPSLPYPLGTLAQTGAHGGSHLHYLRFSICKTGHSPCLQRKAAAAEAVDAAATNCMAQVGVPVHDQVMVIESTAGAAQATAFSRPQIFQRRGVSVTIGAAGATLTPAVAAIIRSTEAPMTAPAVRINN
jgi:hypothetical protein